MAAAKAAMRLPGSQQEDEQNAADRSLVLPMLRPM